jgi:hypothetical protein
VKIIRGYFRKMLDENGREFPSSPPLGDNLFILYATTLPCTANNMIEYMGRNGVDCIE